MNRRPALKVFIIDKETSGKWIIKNKALVPWQVLRTLFLIIHLPSVFIFYINGRCYFGGSSVCVCLCVCACVRACSSIYLEADSEWYLGGAFSSIGAWSPERQNEKLPKDRMKTYWKKSKHVLSWKIASQLY